MKATRTCLSILILISLHGLIKAQQYVVGKVIDIHTNESLPHVNLGIESTSIGDVTDVSGNFKILIPDSLLSSELTFYTQGYLVKRVPISQFREDGSSLIYMTEKVVTLSNVIVKAKSSFNSVSYKVKDKMSARASTSLSQDEYGGSAIAVLYEGPAEGFWINSVKLKIRETSADSLKVKVQFFESLDGSPGKDLIEQALFFSVKGNRGWWEIDLTDLNIYLPSKQFFLSFELVENLPTRIKLRELQERKNQMMFDLYDSGVSNIKVILDSIDGKTVRKTYLSTLSKRQEKKYGVDFSTAKTAFAVASSKRPTFKRFSSFSKWELMKGVSLVSEVQIEYDPSDEHIESPSLEVEPVIEYPLSWGPYEVGYNRLFLQDGTRPYQADYYEDGLSVPIGTKRPIQANIWHPSEQTGNPNITMREYIETLNWAERIVEPDQKKEEELRSSLQEFGLPENYLTRKTKAFKSKQYSEKARPLIVYVPGLSGEGVENYKLLELLASHGYLVVSFPSLGTYERTMQPTLEETLEQVKDLKFIIDWSRKSLPVTNDLTLIGYSWGILSSISFALNENASDIGLISLDGSLSAVERILGDHITLTNRISHISPKGRELSEDDSEFSGLSLEKFFVNERMTHENFVSLGVDLETGDNELKKKYFGELCTIILDILNRQ